jgi:hypothetical protein
MNDCAPTSHAQLVLRACRWLVNTRKCRFVFRECIATCCPEIPDAIGWDGRGRSIAVECKVSRSDFHADKRKSCGAHRVGRLRYYMAPPGILTASDLPPKVGLLQAGKVVRVLVKAEPQEERHTQREIMLLVSEFCRVTRAVRGQPDDVGLFVREDQQLLDGLGRFRNWLTTEGMAQEERDGLR